MSEKQKISVLMSVYVKENPTFLRDAIKSVQNQTLKPSELVLVEDGPLTPELYQVLDEVEAQSDIPVKRCPLEQNQGLGLALRYGVLQCQYDIIARMDTESSLTIQMRLCLIVVFQPSMQTLWLIRE